MVNKELSMLLPGLNRVPIHSPRVVLPRQRLESTGHGRQLISCLPWEKRHIHHSILAGIGQNLNHEFGKMTGKEKYSKLLKKHGVEYDERFFLD